MIQPYNKSDESEVECDGEGCNNSKYYDTTNFKEITQNLRDIGWEVVMENYTWKHYCPSCQEKKATW